MTNNKGFTLIEIVLSIAIIAIIGGVVALLLNSIIESWQYSQNRLELQKASSTIMNELIEGGFEARGIRDAVDFVSCGTDSITFLPLWVDESHKPDPIANRIQKFTLNRQFKVGSSIPLAQYKAVGSDDWTTAKVRFDYGSSSDPKTLDDVVQVLDPIPYGAKLKFTFTAEPSAHPETQKSFSWNQESKRIYSSYNGETVDILKTQPETKVEKMAFIYYDNLNQMIPLTKGYLSDNQMKRATAVKVYVILSKKGDWRESVSYTNIRNISGTGVSIMEGSVVPLPSSARIKAFSIGNFFNRKKDGIVRLVVKPEKTQSWAIQLKIIPDSSSPDRLKVERFQMESPEGKMLTSSFLNQTFMNSPPEFVSMQALDRTGLYDYDDDDGVDDFYISTEDPVFLEVERLDFDGASLFVKP